MPGEPTRGSEPHGTAPGPRTRRSIRVGGLVGGVAVAATAVVYSPTLDGGFVSDDAEELLGSVRTGPRATANLHPGRNLRPLNQWLHARSLAWFGTDPVPQHVLSLLLHLAVAVAVGCAATSLWRAFRLPSRRGVGVAATAIFLLHPSHTEAVSWISARSDLLMALGLAVAVAAWFRSDPSRVAAVLVACAGTALALAAKEPAVTFPAAVAVLEAARGGWRRALRTWPLFVLLVGYVAIRWAALGTLKSGSWWDEFVGDDVARTAVNAVVTPVRAFVPALDFGGPAVALALAGLAVAALRSGRLRRAELRLVGGLGAALVVSTASVARLGASPRTSGGERLVYFPSGLASVVVVVVVASLVRRPLAPAALGVAAGFGLALVPAQLRWSDAAQLSADLTASASALPRDRPAILLGLPDSLGGALVQRNTTGHDLVLVHGWHDPAPVTELSIYEVGAAENRVEVVAAPDGRGLRVRLHSPGARFLEVAGPRARWDVAGYRVRRLDPRTLQVDLPRDGVVGSDRPTLWVARGSAWRRVDLPGAAPTS